MQTMVSAGEALALIRQHVRPLPAVPMHLEDALGRVLAEEIVAEFDVPGFDNSSMDGFALASPEGNHSAQRKYHIIGESAAGKPFDGSVKPGEAVRIMTGAPIPTGTAAVIEVERVREEVGSITFDAYPAAGRHIRSAGEDIRCGSSVLQPGTRLRPSHLGILASLGCGQVRVAPAPRTNVVTTGTELVEPGRTLRAGQIHNSSAFVVPALLREAHAVVNRVVTVSDEPAALREVLQQSLATDLLVTTGGVSAGAYDRVLQVLRDLGVEFLFWKVRIKPGMPMAFGRTSGGQPVVCLPGNPVSTGVTFLQFVRPVLDALEGVEAHTALRWMARIEHEITKKDGKRHYSRGVAAWKNGAWTVRVTGLQSSGMLSSMVQANCLIVVPEGTERLAAGDEVEIEWL